jgi:tetrahydrodipicolinate N-succinyltransferase
MLRENSKNGSIEKRCLIGTNDTYNEGMKIRERKIKEEKI